MKAWGREERRKRKEREEGTELQLTLPGRGWEFQSRIVLAKK